MVTWSPYKNVFLRFIYIHVPASFQAAVSFCLRRYEYIHIFSCTCTNTDTLPKTMCNLTKSLTQQLLSFSIWRLASQHCCQCFSCLLLLLNRTTTNITLLILHTSAELCHICTLLFVVPLESTHSYIWCVKCPLKVIDWYNFLPSYP